MELRATVNGNSVSKTFIAVILVLVAMGLGVTGGYFARSLGTSGASAAGAQQVQVQHEPNRIQKDDSYTSDGASGAIFGGGALVQ